MELKTVWILESKSGGIYGVYSTEEKCKAHIEAMGSEHDGVVYSCWTVDRVDWASSYEGKM